jgi:hypothetical protein
MSPSRDQKAGIFQPYLLFLAGIFQPYLLFLAGIFEP